MGASLGLSAVLYRQTSGTRAAWPGTGAASSLSAITNVKDLTLNIEKGEADVSTRGNNGWAAFKATLKKASLEFQMVYDNADAAVTAFANAFFNGTSIALAVLDGTDTTVGTQGLWADFEVLKYEKAEPLEGAQMISISLKPALTAVAPAWVTVA